MMVNELATDCLGECHPILIAPQPLTPLEQSLKTFIRLYIRTSSVDLPEDEGQAITAIAVGQHVLEKGDHTMACFLKVCVYSE